MEQNRTKRILDVTVSSILFGISLIMLLLFFGTGLVVSGGQDIDFNFFTKVFPDEVKLITETSHPSEALISQVMDDGIIVFMFALCAIISIIYTIISAVQLSSVVSGKKELNTKPFGYAVCVPFIYYIMLLTFKYENGVALGWAGIIGTVLFIIGLALFWVRRIVLADEEKTSRTALYFRAASVGVLLIGGFVGLFNQISGTGFESSGLRYTMNATEAVMQGAIPADYVKFTMCEMAGVLFFAGGVVGIGSTTLELAPTKRKGASSLKSVIISLILMIAASVLICIGFEKNGIGAGSIILMICLVISLVLEILSKNMNKKYLQEQESAVPEIVEEKK